MKILLSIFILAACNIFQTSAFLLGNKGDSPLKLLGKCISDHECEETEYCDHSGINPFGSCKIGYADGQKCHVNRHCKSKYCSLRKRECIGKKLVRDGPCRYKQDDDCFTEQFCWKLKCIDRKCDGWCWYNKSCLSKNCRWFFRCEPSKDNALTANFCKK